MIHWKATLDVVLNKIKTDVFYVKSARVRLKRSSNF